MVHSKEDIFQLIKNNQETITGFGVKSIGLFGSFKTGNINKDSDIDLIVEFKTGQKSYNNFIQLAYFLEELFGRKVELLTTESISAYIRPYIVKNIEYVALAG